MKKINEAPAPRPSLEEVSWRQTRNTLFLGFPCIPLVGGLLSGSPEVALGGALIIGTLELSVMAAFRILNRIADQQSSGDSRTR